jgi:hypothetical protein
MTNVIELPHVADVVKCLVNTRFQDSMAVVNTAQKVHNCLLVPCPLLPDSPLFVFYPPLREVSLARPLTIAPAVQAFIKQLPPSAVSNVFDEDILFPARARLVRAYQHALMQRTDRMAKDATRIDAPFPPMTPAEHQERVAYVVERAITIPIEQTVDWWADVTCGVALTSPSEGALAALAATHPEGQAAYGTINGWRQIGYIIENLQR